MKISDSISTQLAAFLPTSATFATLLVAAWVNTGSLSQAAPLGVLVTPDEPSPENATGKKPDVDITAKDLGVLYLNKDNPIIERFSLTGEFQLQWADGTSNQGSYGSRDTTAANRWGDIEVRRWRVGFESTWFQDFKAWGTIDINPNWTPFYKDIYELAVSYSPSEAFNLGAGKIKTRYFSQEWNTRTRENIIPENSLLVNELTPQQLTGVWVNGTTHNWVYALAVYAGDYQTEFSQFSAGEVTQASLDSDFASALNVDKALLKLDYQGSTSTKNSNGPGLFKDAFSLNSTFQNHRFYGFTDFLAGIGQGKQGDVVGATVTPTYFVVPNKLQAILRFQVDHGDNNGLKLQTRYEDLAPDIVSTKGVGSDYQAVYFGLNYYIYGHNLKLMAGEELNHMTGGPKDFTGWTTWLGLRAAF